MYFKSIGYPQSTIIFYIYSYTNLVSKYISLLGLYSLDRYEGSDLSYNSLIRTSNRTFYICILKLRNGDIKFIVLTKSPKPVWPVCARQSDRSAQLYQFWLSTLTNCGDCRLFPSSCNRQWIAWQVLFYSLRPKKNATLESNNSNFDQIYIK